MANKIAYIDFCKTITNVHTLSPFIKYFSFKKGLFGKLRYYMIQVYRKSIHRHDPNSIFLHFKGMDEDFINSSSKKFYDIYLRKSLNPKVVAIIQNLEAEGYLIVIISNAIPEYIYHLKDLFKIDHIISNQLEIIADKYTDRLVAEKRIYASGKVDAIDKFEIENNIIDYFRVSISDDISDIPMLKLADKAIVVNPNCEELEEYAKKQNWEIIIDK